MEKLIATIGKILDVSVLLGLFPPLLFALNALLALLASGGPVLINKFSKTRIAEAKHALLHGYSDPDPKEREVAAPDMCSRLIAMNEDRGKDKKDDGVDPDILVQGACFQNIGAGSDTTSITLNAALFNVLKHPHVHQRLQAELDEAHAEGRLSDPPVFKETQELPYLEAIIKESLRIHAALGLPLWRQVPAGGVTLHGMYFPPGSNVGINPWVAHRNEVWGPDADEFKPERWLESSEEKLREMNNHYIPFGLYVSPLTRTLQGNLKISPETVY